MHDVVLLYERSCPNVGEARANLERALLAAKLDVRWREVDIDGPKTPPNWRALGSPTILVDGVDIVRGAPAEGATCRLYERHGRFARTPSVDQIVSYLRTHSRRSACSGAHATLAAAPVIGIALLPNVLCPACWPVYATLLSTLGLGFLLQSRYLLPLTVVLIAVATLAIGFRARRRRGYAPAIVAALAGLSLVLAKFVVHSIAATYAATAVFAAAAVWNAWTLRPPATCPACEVKERQVCEP
jgi:mercuric ion transport protein